MRESDVEDYFVQRVAECGGEVRKVKWLGRNKAPDRVAMLPRALKFCHPSGVEMSSCTLWVEFKSPKAVATFPANPHEFAQYREHERMRQMGQHVVVIGTKEAMDELLA